MDSDNVESAPQNQEFDPQFHYQSAPQQQYASPQMQQFDPQFAASQQYTAQLPPVPQMQQQQTPQYPQFQQPESQFTAPPQQYAQPPPMLSQQDMQYQQQAQQMYQEHLMQQYYFQQQQQIMMQQQEQLRLAEEQKVKPPPAAAAQPKAKVVQQPKVAADPVPDPAFSSTPLSQDPRWATCTVYSGYLTKLGSFIKSWKTRFFILTKQSNLYYFKDHVQKEPLGVLNVHGQIFFLKERYSGKNNVLRVIVDTGRGRRQKIFSFFAASEEATGMWIDKLREVGAIYHEEVDRRTVEKEIKEDESRRQQHIEFLNEKKPEIETFMQNIQEGFPETSPMPKMEPQVVLGDAQEFGGYLQQQQWSDVPVQNGASSFAQLHCAVSREENIQQSTTLDGDSVLVPQGSGDLLVEEEESAQESQEAENDVSDEGTLEEDDGVDVAQVDEEPLNAADEEQSYDEYVAVEESLAAEEVHEDAVHLDTPAQEEIPEEPHYENVEYEETHEYQPEEEPAPQDEEIHTEQEAADADEEIVASEQYDDVALEETHEETPQIHEEEISGTMTVPEEQEDDEEYDDAAEEEEPEPELA